MSEKRRELKNVQGRDYAIRDTREIPEWSELMSTSNIYISNTLCLNAEELIPRDTAVILGGSFELKSKTVVFCNGEVVDMKALLCEQHEEADTRIIAHLAYCVITWATKELP